MKNQVEGIEKEMAGMKEKMEKVSKQMFEANQEMNNRIGGKEAKVESLNSYLREQRDTIVGKGNEDKGKL